jgi:hypothetical protein
VKNKSPLREVRLSKVLLIEEISYSIPLEKYSCPSLKEFYSKI